MTTRVLFPFVGDSIGGSHVSAALLMAALPEQGFSPLAVVHRDGPLKSWLRSRDVPVVAADLPFVSARGGITSFASIVSAAPRLALYARSNNFAIVHAHDGRMIATWMGAARLAGSVAIAHRRTRWSPSRLSHLSLRLASGIVAISDFVRDSLPVDLHQRTVVIANPFESEARVADGGRAEIRRLVGGEGPIVAFVGTLQPQKRPDVFLRAAAIMHSKRIDIRFVLIGRDDGMGEPMRYLCQELGIDGITTFTGFRDDARQLLGGCDLLLAPAVDEGHGRVVVEAMLAGVPVVAAASGGHLEIVQPDRTGLLVPADTPYALADAALGLLGDAGRTQNLIKSALSYVNLNFTPHAHAAAVAALYKQFLIPAGAADLPSLLSVLGAAGRTTAPRRWQMLGHGAASPLRS
jgi:glycosyltransferase involved in cell wall biosynthesis